MEDQKISTHNFQSVRVLIVAHHIGDGYLSIFLGQTSIKHVPTYKDFVVSVFEDIIDIEIFSDDELTSFYDNNRQIFDFLMISKPSMLLKIDKNMSWLLPDLIESHKQRHNTNIIFFNSKRHIGALQQ